MARKIVLMLIVLAGTVGVYLYASRSDRAPTGVPFARTATQPLNLIASSQRMEIISGGDISVGPGERGYFRVLDKETGRVQYEFRSKTWNPTSNNIIRMDEPDIRLHAPDGEVTYLTAQQAELEVTKSGKSDMEPRRGWLKGDVRVIVDRSNREWYTKNPDRAERDKHPENLIHIAMSEAHFDMDSSRLTSDGPITVKSEEANIKLNAGIEALSLTWSQVGNPIDFLAFKYGGEMDVTLRSGFVDFGLPGDARVEADERVVMDASSQPGGAASKRRVGPTPEEARLAALDPRLVDMLHDAEADPLLASALADSTGSRRGRSRARGGAHAYHATFKDQVRVEQFNGTEPAGQLDCDVLDLVFDLGDEQRKALGDDGGPGRAASRPADGSTPPADAPAIARSRLVMHWTGPMFLKSADDPAHPVTGRKFEAIATGEHVRVKSGQGTVTCQKVEYHRDPKAAYLYGTDTSPAHVVFENGREVTAPQISVEQDAGKVRLVGAGLIRDPNASVSGGLSLAGGTETKSGGLFGGKGGEPIEIVWTKGVEIDLGKAKRIVVGANGTPKETLADILTHAEFHGAAAMTQGARRLAGDDIVMTFGPPRKPGAMADHITRLECRRDVLLKDGDQMIAAESLNADLTLSSDGRNVPTKMIAEGKVHAEQRDRRFEADRMTLDFHPASMSDTKNTRVAIRRVVADGKVVADDPVGQLDVLAEHLDAELDEAGQLRKTIAVGAGTTGWAYLRQGDYAADGHEVTIDLPTQMVVIPGMGHAAFATRRDFDGRELTSAVPVSITFDKGMTLDGRQNIGLFHGHIRTATDTHELTCDEKLTVRLADDSVTSGSSTAGTASAPAPKAERGAAFAGLARWLGRKDRDVPRAGVASSTARIRKKPTFVLAEGNAVALTTDPDPQGRVVTRLRVNGPTIEADLLQSVVNVRGRGALVVEDYRLPKQGGRPSGRAAGPLGGGNDGPSQTAFFWSGSMNFKVKEDLVTFDRSVQMIHRSGGQLALQGELAAAMGADASTLRLGPGRLATLTCENLVAQFVSQSHAGTKSAGPFDNRWTDLKRVTATTGILLKEGTRTLMGESMDYQLATNILELRGGANTEASMYDEDEATQHASTWHGPLIRWNRATGAIEATQPRITSR